MSARGEAQARISADAPASNDVESERATSSRRSAFVRHRTFLVALTLGPLTWVALAVAGLPMPDGVPPVALLVSSVLLYPPLEEWVFRGMLQGALLRHPALSPRRAGISGANLVTSLVFSASHLLAQSPLQAASVLLPSLVFGHLRERFDSVLPGVLVHAFYNAGFVWLFAAT